MDFSLRPIYGSNQPIDEEKVNPSVLYPSIAEANPSYEFSNPGGWANEVGIQVSNYYHSYPNAPPQFVNTIQHIDVPRFNGAGDFKVWVNQYWWVLGFHNMNDDQKIQMVSKHLEGAAIRWHNAYMVGNTSYISWSEYVFGMSCWFDLRQTDLSMVEWIYLTQKGTLVEYYERFARNRVRIICCEEFAVEYFIGGLREECREFVRYKSPKTVYEAYYWVDVHEKLLSCLDKFDDLLKHNTTTCKESISSKQSEESQVVSSSLSDVMEPGIGNKKVVESNSATYHMELVSSTLGNVLMVKKLSHQEDLEHEPGLEKKEEEVEEMKENGNDHSVSEGNINIEDFNLIDKEHEFVVVGNDHLEGQTLEATIEVGCQVSAMGNCFDVLMEFQSKVLEIDFLGVDGRIEMLQLKVEKKCQMDYVKLVAMGDDGMKKVRKKCRDAYFYTPASIFVHFSYKTLLMECGLITKGDVEWDYKRYKKKVQEGGLHNKFCLLVLAAISLKLLLSSLNS